MPVPLPRVCSILAHEIRTPLSVLQGYIRLLQRQREREPSETAMLEAMLAATGQLTAIARQASELGSWLTSLPPTLPLVRYEDLFAALAQRAATHAALQIKAPPPALASRTLHADSVRLADAIVTTAESVLREIGDGMIEISMTDPHAGDLVGLHVRPLAPVNAPTAPPSRSGARRVLSFDRGGVGLALVAASYVLDAHGAVMTPADDEDEFVIQFPPGGGAE